MFDCMVLTLRQHWAYVILGFYAIGFRTNSRYTTITTDLSAMTLMLAIRERLLPGQFLFQLSSTQPAVASSFCFGSYRPSVAPADGA